jgi:hypothetical protein
MALGGIPPGITEWRPAGLLCKDNDEPENQYALLVLNQPIDNFNILKLVWEKGMYCAMIISFGRDSDFLLLIKSQPSFESRQMAEEIVLHMLLRTHVFTAFLKAL